MAKKANPQRRAVDALLTPLDVRRDLLVDDEALFGELFDHDRVFAFPEIDNLTAMLAWHCVLGDEPGYTLGRAVAALGAGDRIDDGTGDAHGAGLPLSLLARVDKRCWCL